MHISIFFKKREKTKPSQNRHYYRNDFYTQALSSLHIGMSSCLRKQILTVKESVSLVEKCTLALHYKMRKRN